MGRRIRAGFAAGLTAALAFAVAATAGAQQPAERKAPAVGDVAPAFSGRGATRHGRVADPIQLSDYRGKTVVLAFFFRARTSG